MAVESYQTGSSYIAAWKFALLVFVQKVSLKGKPTMVGLKDRNNTK